MQEDTMMEACVEYDFPEGTVPEMPEKRCYTVDELMLILDCGRRTIYDLLLGDPKTADLL